MPYTKTSWVDRNVQFPGRYTDELSNVKTFTASPGTVTAAGTPITAARMNNIENGIEAINNGSHIYAASSTGNDTYAITFSPALTAYATGLVINFKADVANTGSASLNINSLGAKTIKKSVSSDLETGDILAGQICTVIYDGTNFQLVNIAPYTGSQILSKLLPVDGAGSLLDADKLDNKESTDFLQATKTIGNVAYTDSISAGATLTKSIALGSSNFKNGRLVVNSNTYGILVVFDNSSTGALITGIKVASATVEYGSAWSRRHKGWVTEDSIYGLGTYVTGSNYIHIHDVYINGSNIDVVFHNYDSGSRSLACTIDWEVF